MQNNALLLNATKLYILKWLNGKFYVYVAAKKVKKNEIQTSERKGVK